MVTAELIARFKNEIDNDPEGVTAWFKKHTNGSSELQEKYDKMLESVITWYLSIFSKESCGLDITYAAGETTMSSGRQQLAYYQTFSAGGERCTYAFPYGEDWLIYDILPVDPNVPFIQTTRH